MTASKLLLALAATQGSQMFVQATGPQAIIYADQSDTCQPALACSANQPIPANRGLCVPTSATSQQCWDACNTAHPPTAYSNDPTIGAGIALLVKQLRTGMRPGICTGVALTETCDPGQRCTPIGLTLGRGMCVTMQGQGNKCLDMCDPAVPLTTFHDTPGKQAGTVTTVEQVRAGRDPQGRTTCPTPTVWLWLWIPIILLCLVGLCGGAYYMFNSYRRSLKKGRAQQGYREPEPFVEDQMDYRQPLQDEYPQMDREMQMEPMPVVEQPQMMPTEEVMVQQPEFFGAQPDLYAGVIAPQTVTPSYSYPAAGYTTSMPITTMPTAGMTSYPQAGSMMVGGSAIQSRPAYTQQAPSAYGGSMAISGGAMATQMPSTYSAYGAYGGPTTQTAAYPTNSMRIG